MVLDFLRLWADPGHSYAHVHCLKDFFLKKSEFPLSFILGGHERDAFLTLAARMLMM